MEKRTEKMFISSLKNDIYYECSIQQEMQKKSYELHIKVYHNAVIE